eukprot:753331-Hanusia_phi.AAC.1
MEKEKVMEMEMEMEMEKEMEKEKEKEMEKEMERGGRPILHIHPFLRLQGHRYLREEKRYEHECCCLEGERKRRD